MYKFWPTAIPKVFLIPATLFLCIVMIIVLTACQPAPRTQTSPATTPPVNPPPTTVGTPGAEIKWVADGVISANEYQNTKDFGDYSVNWSNDSEFIYAGLKAKTAGWVAVGFGPEILMKNADIIVGFVKDGSILTMADTFSTGEFGPHPPDTQLGGTSDILASAGKTDGVYTVIEFKRKLDTGDKFDKPLAKGINKIIWAYSGEPILTVKHSLRGAGEIELK